MSRLLTLLAASDPGFVPSNYMPAVRVEVAFNAGYTTPDADRVWTDVSEWVELHQGITDTFGRQDERSTADANDLTLTLDNSDGRFTAGRAASPYYPNVKIGRPIRLSLMTVSGYTSVRFVGFVNQWPVEWDGTDAYAKATITAGSRLSRLGLGQKLRSVVETAILSPRPIGYWTLGDSAGATLAAESSGVAAGPLAVVGAGGAVTFGNAVGPAFDGLSAAEFAGTADRVYLLPVDASTFTGQYLAGMRGSAVLSARATARVTSLPTGSGAEEGYAYLLNFGTNLAVTVDETGNVCIRTSPTGAAAIAAASISDGGTHDIALVLTPGVAYQLYVDGVSSGPPVATAHTVFPGSSIEVGQGFTGSMSHVAVYDVELTAAQVAIHADAVLTGFAGDRTDERLTRLLEWAGVPSAEVNAEVGSETMTYQQTDGMSVGDALREVESTEGGVLFDGADGRVTFHNRSHRYTAPVAVTFDMAEQQVEAGYAPKLDRSTLANSVRVENPTTGWTADVVGAASVDEYGTVTGSSKALTDTYPPLVQKAWWLVASYAEPRPRVPSLTVDVLAQVGGTPSAEDILALTIGSRIKVTNQPSQADATEADYFVEGYSEAIGPESYRITFNLSPAHPSLSTFVLDDADRGVLDTGILAH